VRCRFTSTEHGKVFRYRTPRVIRAFVPRIAGFFEFAPVSASVSARQKGGFDLLSLHRKIPFLTRISETGSMTEWWVASLCPSASTIQSSQTAHFVGDSKEAVSAGISPVSSPDFLSLWTSAVSRANFWPPVSASKNSVPATWISRGKGPFRGLEIGDSGRQKCRFCSDEIGREERKRNRHIALTRTAFFLYAICSAPITEPDTISSSQRQPRAIALNASNCRSFAKPAQLAKG
jgi:hypothetical protein